MKQRHAFIRLAALALLSLLLWPGSALAAKNKFKKASVRVEEKPRLTYWVYVPEDAGSGPLPLVLFLHGSAERGDRALSVGLPLMINEGKIEPPSAVYVVPQLADDLGKWNYMEVQLLAMLEKVMGDYPVDESRVTLAGYSLGGNYAWEMAARWPDLFPRVACVCSRVEAGIDPISLLTCDVRVYIGSQDHTVIPDSAIAFEKELEEAGVRAKLFTYAGGHGEAGRHVFEDQTVVDWLCWAE